MTAPVAGAVRGRPSAARLSARAAVAEARTEHVQIEMAARQQEASLYTRAQRMILRDLEAVLLRHSAEVPVEAVALVARLRGMTDRYDSLWAEAAA